MPGTDRRRCARELPALLGLLLLLAACGVPRPVPDGSAATRFPVPSGGGAAPSAEAEPAFGPATGLASRYAPRPGSRVFRLRPELSLVQIQVYREGSLARLGHNHLIAVRDLRGWWRQEAGGRGSADLWFAVDRLTVDEPGLRLAAGPGFERQPEPAAVAATRGNLLGERVLAADRFPWVRIEADYHPATAEAELWIELRGIRRGYRVAVQMDEEGGLQTVRGALALRQSDFGLAPFSALGGALRVADELRIRFRVVAEPVGG